MEFLLRTAVGRSVTTMLTTEDLLAPELLDAEVISVMRRLVRGGRVPEPRARTALDDLRDWDVARISHRFLIEEVWRLRDRVSSYDALYVAAARLTGAAVLTADGPLARGPALGVVIHNARGPGSGAAHDSTTEGRYHARTRRRVGR